LDEYYAALLERSQNSLEFRQNKILLIEEIDCFNLQSIFVDNLFLIFFKPKEIFKNKKKNPKYPSDMIRSIEFEFKLDH